MCACRWQAGASIISRFVASFALHPYIHIGNLDLILTLFVISDCKTDVYFNTLSLLFPLIGGKFDIWWLDPIGAGLLSLYIIYDWASTCVENVTRLTGIGADEEIQKKLLYLAYRFSPVVDGYKSITAYHVSYRPPLPLAMG